MRHLIAVFALLVAVVLYVMGYTIGGNAFFAFGITFEILFWYGVIKARRETRSE
jgi:hypothetical protein